MREVCEVTQRRARKVHICDICGKRIYPGCEYISVRSAQNGRFWYSKQHIHCDALASAYTKKKGGIEQMEHVAEWLRDEVCESCPERETCEAGKYDTFACEIVHKSVLPATLLAAAMESAMRNDDG